MKTNKIIQSIQFLALLFIAVTINSCSDDSGPVVENEVITTVITTLRNGNQTITLTFRDLDADGPNEPVVTVSGNLTANTTYTGEVEIIDETKDPDKNVTEEILEKDLEHQLFFQIPSALATVQYTDADSEGKPIGLAFNLATGSAGSGNLIVTLRHEPNKSAEGVSMGNIANAGGSTDVEVTYPIVVN
jgi:hypothetical protein